MAQYSVGRFQMAAQGAADFHVTFDRRVRYRVMIKTQHRLDLGGRQPQLLLHQWQRRRGDRAIAIHQLLGHHQQLVWFAGVGCEDLFQGLRHHFSVTSVISMASYYFLLLAKPKMFAQLAFVAHFKMRVVNQADDIAKGIEQRRDLNPVADILDSRVFFST